MMPRVLSIASLVRNNTLERPADHYEQDLLNIVEIVVMVKCRGQMLEDDHQIDWKESMHVVKRTSTKRVKEAL